MGRIEMSGGMEEAAREEQKHASYSPDLLRYETNELYHIRKELKNLEARIEVLINRRLQHGC